MHLFSVLHFVFRIAVLNQFMLCAAINLMVFEGLYELTFDLLSSANIRLILEIY